MSKFINYKKADSQQSGIGAFPSTMSNIVSTTENTMDANNVLSSDDIYSILKKIKP